MTETRIEIVVTGGNAEATIDQLASQLQDSEAVVSGADTAAQPAELIASSISASAALPQNINAWFAQIAVSEGYQPLATLAICAVIFAIAYLLERVIARLLSGSVSEPVTTLQKLGNATRWGGARGLSLLAFYGMSLVGIHVVFDASTEAFELAAVALSSLMLPRAWLLVLEVLTGSQDPHRRANSLSDLEASHVMRSALCLVVFFAATAFARDFVLGVVDAGDSGALFAVATRALDAMATGFFFFSVRKPVGGLIVNALSCDTGNPKLFVRLLSRFWPALYIFLFLLQIIAEARGYLSGTLGEDASALKRSFAVFVLTPFIVASLGIWRDDLMSRTDWDRRGRVAGVFSLLEGTVTVGAAIFILYAWNIDPFATDLEGAKRILPGLVSAAIVTVIGVSAWRMISGFFDKGTVGGADDEANVPDGEGGVGGSRLETVLPILRTALAVLIGTVTVLLALSSLGVQIAPLLAGAGILGLAVGFGAQKIVEDIISGVLYLIEDAFRKGEYIETNEGQGVVDAIMLRSIRLRHHLGAVYTVPFSSIGTVQNHSRDWVTVKLSFEVAPTQDLEKVRKLVKKVGAQLMQDPELEGQFLAPLKSQGAVAMVGSNYKIGVKFTSKPGEQFLIRRKALNAIQKAFSENNVQIAAPRVIVDTGGEAAAAAAKTVIDRAAPA
ncbi:mechanosensitive ion channel family protein [Roseobacter denitrificans]|nr:mechanosensitive ion channel family protein [Roseobacter denitrificans]AVL53031.1 mechanosensitive ion channel family protein [Roseobacter denitrificans]SFG26714.1 Small-conductance mechanosensitive channel [Roseobacter denitrificans OCh 114]